MLKMIIVILGLIILFLLPVLWKKQKQISMIQEKLDDAKAEAKRMKAQLAEEKQLSESQLEEQKKQIENRERMEQDMIDCTSKSQDVLKAIHTIHLYASISEEEAQSQQMKENQRTIIEICEEILAKTSEL